MEDKVQTKHWGQGELEQRQSLVASIDGQRLMFEAIKCLEL